MTADISGVELTGTEPVRPELRGANSPGQPERRESLLSFVIDSPKRKHGLLRNGMLLLSDAIDDVL